MGEKRINDFINLAIQSGGWMILDRVYLKNRLISLIGELPEAEEVDAETFKTSTELLEEMLVIAEQNKKIDSTNQEERDQLEAEIMELLTPPPSVVNALFSQHYDNSAKEATDYYHLLNINNAFINSQVYDKKELTLGKSQIVLQKKQDQSGLENKCQQCFESEGFGFKKNRIKRIIRMNLKGESWGFFYEANPLFDEQCLFVPEIHEKMTLDRQMQETMLRLVDIYPHYFVSFDELKNQTKDHSFLYGGSKKLPLLEAEEDYKFDIPGFVTVQASLVDWPLSVIRLRTPSKKNLINSIEYLTLRWQQYSYPSLDIMANDEKGNTQHFVRPIFRKEQEDYVADLILVDKSQAFKRSTEYENALFDKHSLVDELGVVNLKADLEINNRLEEIILKNFEKQGIFKKTPEGETSFIRFIDTL